MDKLDRVLSERYTPKVSGTLANRIVASVRKRVENNFSLMDLFTPQYSFAMVAILLIGLNVGFETSLIQYASDTDTIYSETYSDYSFAEDFI